MCFDIATTSYHRYKENVFENFENKKKPPLLHKVRFRENIKDYNLYYCIFKPHVIILLLFVGNGSC